MTNDDKKIVRVLCIYYQVRFQKEQVKVLLNSGSKVNAINLNFAQKLDLKISKTNVKA